MTMEQIDYMLKNLSNEFSCFNKNLKHPIGEY